MSRPETLPDLGLRDMLLEYGIEPGRLAMLEDPELRRLGRNLLAELDLVVDSLRYRGRPELLSVPLSLLVIALFLISPLLGPWGVAGAVLILAIGVGVSSRFLRRAAPIPIWEALQLTPLLMKHAEQKLMATCFEMENAAREAAQSQEARFVRVLEDDRSVRIRVLSRYLHEMTRAEHETSGQARGFSGIANAPYGLAATLSVLRLLSELLHSRELAADSLERSADSGELTAVSGEQGTANREQEMP